MTSTTTRKSADPTATLLADADYERLLRLRTSLRGFLHWSARQARAAGVTPAQHQLLLAVRGHRGEAGPTIGEVADYLFLRHHSAVELVDRAQTAGLVDRRADADDGRVTRVVLTAAGRRHLQRLSTLHLEELRRLAASLQPLLQGLTVSQADHGGSLGAG